MTLAENVVAIDSPTAYDPSLPYKVADLAQADFGDKEMQLAENEMPGLMAVREKYGPRQPLKGLKVTGSLHMTIQNGSTHGNPQ
jgi:adenosylhomocysteinase